jgi:glycosyltransferase involved in cell wall biosynthesis
MISNEPLVTIVTPSYNQGRFIKATIESVLTQDYPYVEYVIVDGASKDETAEVVRPYEGRLRFISERDRGQTHAVNKGFALARGEIVAWLNSDDVFLPGAIRRAVDAFKANPTAGVAYGGGFQIDEGGEIKQRFPYTQHFDLWKLIFTSDYILNQSAFFRKAALDAVGPLREELYYIMDWEILIRLGIYFDFAYIPEDIGCLREYGTAKTFTGGLKRVAEIRKILFEYTGQHFPPGVIIYGLDTYQQLWNAQIEAWPGYLDFAKSLAHKIVRSFTHRVIQWADRRGQAWWRDMWMGPSAYTMLPQGRGDVVMRGMVPCVEGLDQQTVRIYYRRRVIHEETLKPGNFELRFSPPMDAEESPIFHIRSSQSFTFAKAVGSSDHRVLSLRTTEFRWVNR